MSSCIPLLSCPLLSPDDVVRRLKHLTTSIRLDYYQLMDDIEKTQFYAAQQVEAGLQNYQPQRVVVCVCVCVCVCV